MDSMSYRALIAEDRPAVVPVAEDWPALVPVAED